MGKETQLLAGRPSTNFPFLTSANYFLQPKEPLSMDVVGRNWINTAGTIDEVANRCHPAYTVQRALGFVNHAPWDADKVHILITIEEPGWCYNGTPNRSTQSSAVVVPAETRPPEVVNRRSIFGIIVSTLASIMKSGVGTTPRTNRPKSR